LTEGHKVITRTKGRLRQTNEKCWLSSVAEPEGEVGGGEKGDGTGEKANRQDKGCVRRVLKAPQIHGWDVRKKQKSLLF